MIGTVALAVGLAFFFGYAFTIGAVLSERATSASHQTADRHALKILSIDLPLASSSTSLSR